VSVYPKADLSMGGIYVGGLHDKVRFVRPSEGLTRLCSTHAHVCPVLLNVCTCCGVLYFEPILSQCMETADKQSLLNCPPSTADHRLPSMPLVIHETVHYCDRGGTRQSESLHNHRKTADLAVAAVPC
jgi:hypothetical protein